MKGFFIGLQFLTRIKLVKQEIWTAEDFGKSVIFFPLIGAVLGLCYVCWWAVAYWLPQYFQLDIAYNFFAAMLVVLTVILTGGIHCDGFMDTVDGIFSGRSREKMLEIMKDSRVGSFGATAMVLLFLIEYSLLLDIKAELLPIAIFVMPIMGRLMMLLAITFFPYGRPEGLGKAFADYNTKKTGLKGLIYTLIGLSFFRLEYILFSLCLCLLFTYTFCKYVKGLLGGLTGDVYGGVCVLNEAVVLFSFLFLEKIFHCFT